MKNPYKYEYDQVYKSLLTNHFYFAKRVRIERNKDGKDTGSRTVIGLKIDITNNLQPYLLSKYRIVA